MTCSANKLSVSLKFRTPCTTSDTKEVVVEQTWLSGTSPRSEGLFCCILRFIEINNFRNIFTPLQSVYHSNINTILVAVGVKLCPKGVSTRITYLLATSFAARLGDLLRPQRLKLRTSSFYMSHRSTSVCLYNGHFNIHTPLSTNHSTALQLRFWSCYVIG